MNDENEFTDRPDLIKARARTLIATRLFIGFVVTVLIAALAIMTINALVSFNTRATLVDCTIPEGQCYQRGQQQTANVVQQLIDANELDEVATRRIVILAAACVEQGNSTAEEIQACVDRELKEDRQTEDNNQPNN